MSGDERTPAKLPDGETELRKATLGEAIQRSYELLDRVLLDIEVQGKTVKGICVLYSGGNDSTILAHLMSGRATHAVHINTGIGVRETREFVRRTCTDLRLPLIEESPTGVNTYESLVTRFGFPGPAGHSLMFRRLKERQLEKVRRRFVPPGKGRRERVVFLAGMRVFESSRRWRNTNEVDRKGAAVFVSPIAHWTDEHMSEYRQRFDVPLNEVTANLHMSGECLCGAFAKPGELEMIAFFYPETAAAIRDLERKATAAGVHDKWGTRPRTKATKSLPADGAGLLCQKCEADI